MKNTGEVDVGQGRGRAVSGVDDMLRNVQEFFRKSRGFCTTVAFQRCTEDAAGRGARRWRKRLVFSILLLDLILAVSGL